MKLYNVHGVELTSIQQMMFDKWLNNSGIAMNTIALKSERTAIVQNWLNNIYSPPQ